MGDKFLSQVIDIDEFLSNNQPVIISAGVGAGKNYWIENILSKYGSVLLITSRRQIVDEIVERNNNDFIETLKELEWKSGKRILPMTHAKLYKYIRSCRDMEQLLEGAVFDFIVVDEAHSLIADATFTKSAYHLLAFIGEFRKKVRRKLILMSGTSNIIVQQFVEGAKFKHIDMMKECRNVKPNSISIISKRKAIEIMQNANKDNKMIYMACSATDINDNLIESITSKKQIKVDAIGAVMAESRAKDLNVDVKKIDYITDYLCKNQSLPDDIDILLTTSKLKEGVNIKDPRVKIAFCESHNEIDIIQFSGRMRNGVEKLYIIHDSTQNPNNYSLIEYDYCKNYEVQEANKVLKSFIDKNPIILKSKGEPYAQSELLQQNISINPLVTDKNCKEFIELIEKKWDFICFNYFSTEFKIYGQRKYAIDHHNKNIDEYKQGHVAYIKRITGVDNVKSEYKSIKSMVQDYLINNNLIDKKLNSRMQDKILKDLTEFGIQNSRKEDFTQLGRLLKPKIYGYKLIRVGKTENNIVKITKFEEGK